MNRTEVFSSGRESYYLEKIRRYGPEHQHYDQQTMELLLSIVFTYDLVNQCTAKYMAEYGLSKSTFNILVLLRYGPPEGMQLHDLGEMLLVSRANITGLIDHLEEKGFVTREVSEQDRRARYAKVTPKAEVLLNEFMPVHYQNMRMLMAEVSDSNKERLVQLLSQVRSSVQRHPEGCAHMMGENSRG